MRALRVFISAGELSGDNVGARVAATLRRVRPGVQLSGIGGPRMAAAGVTLVSSAEHIGTVGVSEVLSAVPDALRLYAQVRAHLTADRPDVVLVIGNDLFNTVLARWLRRRAIPVVSLFPPQVWLWRPFVPVFARSFDLVLTSFPEEETRYRRAGVDTRFVGHYLADELAPVTPDLRAEARSALGLSGSAVVLGVLPGSRRHEIARHLPGILDAIGRLRVSHPDLEVVLAAVPARRAEIDAHLASHPSLGVRIVEDGHAVLRASNVVACCSGTATLEASLLEVPHVIVYRMSVLTGLAAYLSIAVRLLPNDTIGLPNLLLGRNAVREVKQFGLSGRRLHDALCRLLDDAAARSTLAGTLARIRPLVTAPGAIARVCDAVCELAAPQSARRAS